MDEVREVAGLHVRVRGDGPAVLLLHGNGEDAGSLTAVADDLARDHRVVAPDARAHGRSPRGTGPLTIARMADDAAAVLAAVEPRAVHVVGYSDGGNVGIMLALRHPQAVRSLVVFGANLDPAGLTAGTRAGVTAAWLGRRLLAVGERAGRGGPGPRRVRAEVTDLMVRQPRIPARALARIAVPVLVMAGEHDVVRQEHTRAIAAHLADGELEIVPGADHGLPAADPATLVARVRRFLAERFPDGPSTG